LPESGVVVEANLGIRSNKKAGIIFCQWIHLNHGAVGFDEKFVQRLHLLLGGFV